MRYVFGDCIFDTERYVLHRAGQPIRLRPKVFQLLVYLLTHRERVVTKQELSERRGKGRFISDTTLESTLAAVRLALGDKGRDHRLSTQCTVMDIASWHRWRSAPTDCPVPRARPVSQPLKLPLLTYP